MKSKLILALLLCGLSFIQTNAETSPTSVKVLVFANNTDQGIATTLEVSGSSLRLDVPAQSMNTVVIR